MTARISWKYSPCAVQISNLFRMNEANGNPHNSVIRINVIKRQGGREPPHIAYCLPGQTNTVVELLDVATKENPR